MKKTPLKKSIEGLESRLPKAVPSAKTRLNSGSFGNTQDDYLGRAYGNREGFLKDVTSKLRYEINRN